ncbi:hypothetical protein [Dyella sp. RRB7]|uniref:hypothetical protein n=1 Tax=Dyella sp. RRB7 TaxID=2919502 RepID=UPI001FAA742B|nr:hypothetical protein [Dyella sp. RRB7]
MNRLTALFQSKRKAASENTYDRARRRYLRNGMTADMADLLVTMAKVLDMPPDERNTSQAGLALQARYRAYYLMAENDFAAIADNRAFATFKRELDRLNQKAVAAAMELQA